MHTTPILYSFRRCPYAIRARLAIQSASVQVELREILLRDKAPKFLEASKSKTVPCLQTADNILDESLEIMIWALKINDPSNWLKQYDESIELIETCDGPFKNALDRTTALTAAFIPGESPPEVNTAILFMVVFIISFKFNEYNFEQLYIGKKSSS